jgi:DNA invertase Pin-like site-specific DNA recombinase
MPSAIYARVSTEDQNLDRQLNSTQEYAESDLGVPLNELEVFRDKSTGTDTSRSGYRDMMDAVEEGGIDHVIVHEISRLARSL